MLMCVCLYTSAMDMVYNNIFHVGLVLEFSCATLAKSLMDAVADPWLTLITKQQQGVVCPDLCSVD